MKIDIHTHTRKTKDGDSEHRNIDAERFDEIIRLTDVRILAITNHNHFDFEQYEQIRKKVQDVCQIWPGIELDIVEDGRRAHLIVIVSPKKAKKFNEKIGELLKGKTADKFTISLSDTVISFNSLDPIYIAHYSSKKPNLLDEDVNKLLNLVSNRRRVLKEATNSISAGIYINHGHNSIYGSDVHKWDDYPKLSKDLPELRLPVESFEQFCLLLEKDTSTIDTILDKKTKERIQLKPFTMAELIDLDIYNDINIIFGSKGTGKTEILTALSRHYNEKGFKNSVYVSSDKRLDVEYDLKGTYYDVNVEDLGVESCTEEFKSLRNASEKNVTSISSYLRYYSAEQSNKIAKSIKINKLNILDEATAERKFDEVKNILNEIQKFDAFIAENTVLSSIIGRDLHIELIDVIHKILVKLKKESGARIQDFHSITLFNQLVKVFTDEIARKTGQPKKPTATGFIEYARNRIKIERDIGKILFNLAKPIAPIIKDVGNLGEKGMLRCQTNLTLQNGTLSDSSYTPIKKVNKSPQKGVASKLKIISKHLYSNLLFEKITELKEVEGSETINSLSDLLLFYRHFTLDGNYYMPSSGESSMVLLHNELLEDKDIYIIDEPEKSLGNDYISNVIVPILKERAQGGKKVIIATHDANIAVRTLPYNSIYREHDIKGYYTYTGNPFSNNMKCINGSKEDLDWKEISMKTLEGGKAAFGERSKIYGNT